MAAPQLEPDSVQLFSKQTIGTRNNGRRGVLGGGRLLCTSVLPIDLVSFYSSTPASEGWGFFPIVSPQSSQCISPLGFLLSKLVTSSTPGADGTRDGTSEQAMPALYISGSFLRGWCVFSESLLLKLGLTVKFCSKHHIEVRSPDLLILLWNYFQADWEPCAPVRRRKGMVQPSAKKNQEPLICLTGIMNI